MSTAQQTLSRQQSGVENSDFGRDGGDGGVGVC